MNVPATRVRTEGLAPTRLTSITATFANPGYVRKRATFANCAQLYTRLWVIRIAQWCDNHPNSLKILCMRYWFALLESSIQFTGKKIQRVEHSTSLCFFFRYQRMCPSNPVPEQEDLYLLRQRLTSITALAFLDSKGWTVRMVSSWMIIF